MDFSRRSFLNLLGITAAATAVEPLVPLFGSDVEASSLVVPDRHLTGKHFVVKPKAFLERLSETEHAKVKAMGSGVVGRIVKNREPKHAHLIRDGYLYATPMLFDGMSVRDAHSSFYVASHDVREKFAEFTRATIAQVEPELRPMASLVTIVDAPIHATPATAGYSVRMRFRQFVVIGASRDELTTYETYSEHGEFPVDVPRDVELGILLRIDREVLSAGEARTGRVARLLAGRSW